MPSRQQSPTSSTSSTKKAGHQRNPMACTNCRARKIKCDSNKRYPDHPCQRCVNRKLVCEYVAIAHTPSSDERSRSGSFSSPIYPSATLQDSNGTSHHSTGGPSHVPPRYSPLSASYHSRRSSRSDTSYSSSSYNASQYPSSHNSYSDSSPVIDSPHMASSLYGSYSSSNGNYNNSILPPGSHTNQMPHLSTNLRSPTPQYGGVSSGMPGVLGNGVTAEPGHFYDRSQGYDWNGYPVCPPNTSQGQFCPVCLLPGMQCTCGDRRYY